MSGTLLCQKPEIKITCEASKRNSFGYNQIIERPSPPSHVAFSLDYTNDLAIFRWKVCSAFSMRFELLFNRRNCIGQRLNCDTMKFYFGSTSDAYPTSVLQLKPFIKSCSYYLGKLEVEKLNQPYEGCLFSHGKGGVWTVWRS